MSETSEREAFEAAITSSPFERNIDRWPNDASRFAWPGNYKDIAVNLAWCMWQERARRSPAPPVEGSMPAGREEWLPPHALIEALRKIDATLTNLQPHIPQSCYPGRETFIDVYVDVARETARAALAAMSTSPKEPTP